LRRDFTAIGPTFPNTDNRTHPERATPIAVIAHHKGKITVKSMDKTIRKYTSFDEMKADEYRYWQSRPVHERIQAVSELFQEH
jgi:hypothetical protein